LIHRQVEFGEDNYQKLWLQIIRQKISNQSMALSILGASGAKKIAAYAENLTVDDIDQVEELKSYQYLEYEDHIYKSA